MPPRHVSAAAAVAAESRQIDGGVPGELGNSPSTRALPRRSLSPSLSPSPSLSFFLLFTPLTGITHARVNAYTRRTQHGRLRNRLSSAREAYLVRAPRRGMDDSCRLGDIQGVLEKGRSSLSSSRRFLAPIKTSVGFNPLARRGRHLISGRGAAENSAFVRVACGFPTQCAQHISELNP